VIDRLRRILDQVDPMPEVIAAPSDAVDKRLTVLPDQEGMRSQAHTLRFGGVNTVLQLEIGEVVTGVVDPVDVEVVVRWPDGVAWAEVDERGLFEIHGVPNGPVRFVVGGAVTDWFVR
jgi:hypothetical protein